MKKRTRASNRLRTVETLEPRRLLAADIVISELLAVNDTTLRDEDGNTSDWLELHNRSDEPINLNGWYLSDDETDLTKWKFPGVSIEPSGYLTVFASDKNRSSAGSPLHTNFKLSSGGEFLALSDPAGEIVHSYSPQFPAQSSDVSFGLQTPQFQLVSSGATGRAFVPSADTADENWTDVAFDDGDWMEITNPIGFDNREAFENAGFEQGDMNRWQVFGGGVAVTDSIGVVPPQGEFQGRLNSFQNVKSRSQLERFLDLESRALNEVGGGNANRGSVMKRTITVQAGDVIEFEWNLLTNEPLGTGNADFALFSISPGVGGIKIADVAQEMAQSESDLVRETGYQSFSYEFPESGTFKFGLGIINMESSGGESSLLIDNVRINGRGDATGLFTDKLGTNIQTELAGINSSIWSRYEFDVASTDGINSLLVRAQYDDGVAIYLNGNELAVRNIGADIAWNSAAESNRDDNDALEVERILLPIDQSLLRVGKNVLAVQGATTGLDDANAFFNVELIGVGVVRNTTAYFDVPTPGGPNVTTDFNVTSPVMFDVDHGIYEKPFAVTLTTPTVDGVIRFTTDGSVPTDENGETYSAPIQIGTTTVVRAVTMKEGFRASDPETRTYLFLNDVVNQSDEDAIALGFPDTWGEFDPERWPVKEADYEMDPQILGPNDQYNGKYKRQIHDSLLSLPSLSLVMDVDDIFGPNGFHQDPRNRGVDWERPTSVELIYPDGTKGFQIDAGIRIQGGVSRVISQKQSFRLLFKDEYGDSKLNFPFFGPGAAETFDSITLRSSTGEFLLNDVNNPGLHYIREEHLRRSQLATGNLSGQGNFMHLYING
ncbi:MAG: lamin tail domain-containing protein, partial [Planctomycetales bacterium]|nr:lamin tail domain-containing protein [Planctomycetales bacterium]